MILIALHGRNFVKFGMYDFMFNDYCGEIWPVASKRREEALQRGTVFAADIFRAIFDIWGELAASSPCHLVDKVTIRLVTGGQVAITPTLIRIDAPPTHETMRAAMRHIAEQWGGKAILAYDPAQSREERLFTRAYADVFGIELDDRNEGFRATAFTLADLARLPALCAEIRAHHPDAPPARPSATEALEQLRPFRVPRAA